MAWTTRAPVMGRSGGHRSAPVLLIARASLWSVFKSNPSLARIGGSAGGRSAGAVDELFVTRDGLRVGGLIVPAEQALSVWFDHSAAATTTGLWPVILGDRMFGADEELRRFIDSVSERYARS